MNIPRPKTSKGNRELRIEKIIDDLDAILTAEPSQQQQPSKSPAQTNHQPSSASKKQTEISAEEQDELINEFLLMNERSSQAVNVSRSATSNSVVPPLDLVQVASHGGGGGQLTATSRREPASSSSSPAKTQAHRHHDQVCRHCGAQTVSVRLTPVTSRISCLKCSHTYETDDKPARSDSPIDPTTSRTANYASNTTRRSSEQSDREDGAENVEDAGGNQKAAKKHKHKRCRLCNKNRNAVRFLPCKHKACANCANELTQCPVERCQLAIEEKVSYHRSKSVGSKKNED